MMKELTEKEAFDKASAYCSRGEHCPSEVLVKLWQWGFFDEEAKQRIICRLIDEGYVDEARFCEAYVHDKFHFNHWGRQKIKAHLLQKRVGSHFIEEALQAIDDDEMQQTAMKLLQAKLKNIHGDNPYEIYTKLMRFAAGRGIEMEMARKCVKLLLAESADDLID